MNQLLELPRQIFQILTQLEESYKKCQKIDETLRIKLYETLKSLPNYDEVIEEFERIFSLSYDENDINSTKVEHEEEASRKCVNSGSINSSETPKSSEETPKGSPKSSKLQKSSTEVQETFSENQIRSSEVTVNLTAPLSKPRLSMTEKERNQMCVELFADFGAFFNKSLSKVGFKYCTETEITRTEGQHFATE